MASKSQDEEKVDINQAKVLFRFEVDNISSFLDSRDSRERKESERFWCRGIQWSIRVNFVSEIEGLKNLAIFLVCHSGVRTYWSCKVYYKVTLISDLSFQPNLSCEFLRTFQQEQYYGFPNFISCAELTDKEKGFINDDKIIVEVELKAGPVFGFGS